MFQVIHMEVPASVKLPGRRTQPLSAAVLDDGKLVAVFADERKAQAYARRLNQWIEQWKGENRA